MKWFSLILTAIFSITAFADEPAAKKPPTYVDAGKVKAYWIKKLPAPKRLAKDYHQVVKAHAAFTGEINSGLHDTEAARVAAEYNRGAAIKAGDVEMAKLFEAELARITQEEIAAEKAKQEKQRSSDMRNQMLIYQGDLKKINATLNRIATP